MSQTLDAIGRPLFFPSSMETDDAGVILARPLEDLAPLVAEIAPNQLLPFVRRLINGTAKRKRQPRWAAVNKQRLILAKLCIDRALREDLHATA